MPVTNWQSTFIDGVEYLVIDVAKLRIPLEWDPSSNVFIAVAAPDGGVLSYPALVQGDPGTTPDIDSVINFTAFEPDDPTPDFASFTETSPNLYQLNLGLHKGQEGSDGTMILDVNEYGTPVAGRTLILGPAADEFIYAPIKVGDRFVPASIADTPSGNATYTQCQIPVAAQPFDWRPHVEGQTIFTGTGSDVGVDLVARLQTTGTVNGETAGPIVGKGFGPIGTNAAQIATVFSSSPPPNSSATYDKVLANNTATIWIRGERRTGANTFTTDADTSIFSVRVQPIP